MPAFADAQMQDESVPAPFELAALELGIAAFPELFPDLATSLNVLLSLNVSGMTILEDHDDVIDIGRSFNANLNHAVAFRPERRIKHAAEVKRGYRVLVQNARLGCRSTSFRHRGNLRAH